MDFALAVGAGFAECPANVVLRDPDFRDLVVVQKCLEFAVGNRLNGLAVAPPLLQEYDRPDRGDDVPDVDLCFLFHPITSSTGHS